MEALIGQVKQRTGRQTLGSNRNWPTAAAHRLRPYRSASGLKSREHPWCPEVQDWGRSTSFAARNRDPTVALSPQCLRGSESGPAACARTVRRPGPSAAMARRAARLPIPSVRAEEHSFRRIRAARCLSRQASLRGPRLKRAPQVAPKRSEGVTDSGVAFSLVPFSWRRKRKVLRRRAHIPAPALGKGTQSFQ